MCPFDLGSSLKFKRESFSVKCTSLWTIHNFPALARWTQPRLMDLCHMLIELTSQWLNGNHPVLSFHRFYILNVFYSLFTCSPPSQHQFPLVPLTLSICLPIFQSDRLVGAISSQTTTSYRSSVKPLGNLFIPLTCDYGCSACILYYDLIRDLGLYVAIFWF